LLDLRGWQPGQLLDGIPQVPEGGTGGGLDLRIGAGGLGVYLHQRQRSLLAQLPEGAPHSLQRVLARLAGDDQRGLARQWDAQALPTTRANSAR
jgi:hypothetical protein